MKKEIKKLSNSELLQLYRLLKEYLDIIDSEKVSKEGDKEWLKN